MARELEPGAERIQCLHHVETALRGRRQLLLLRQRQVAIGAHLAAADAAAQLIELGQAEHVGAVDHHGVGVADVEPAFDDVGRQQHVELAVDEVLHGVLDRRRRQPPVRHGHADLGHQFAQLDGCAGGNPLN